MTKVVVSKILNFKEECLDDIDKNNILAKAKSNIEQAVLDDYIINVFDFEVQNDHVGEIFQDYCPTCNGDVEYVEEEYYNTVGNHSVYVCNKCKVLIHIQESPIITNIEPVDDEDNEE